MEIEGIRTDEGRIAAFADYLRGVGTATPFDFCSRSEGLIYPERGRPGVIETFFFACAHQFGFWTLAGDRWDQPMVARLDGHALKGSDYLFRACTRAWQKDPVLFHPATLAGLSDARLSALFQDDEGHNPLPMWTEHLELIHGYRQWFVSQKYAPADLVRRAQAAPRPLREFLDTLAEIPGYAEDPLRKKAMLLAVVLENRPEKFLRATDPDSAVPIIDYHLQRSALRTGLVRVEDPGLRARLEARKRLDAAEEAAVRLATYRAIETLIVRSGLSAAAVDWFFFQNRTRCPEATEPDCAACPVHDICARETRLFQPVFRTTAY